MTEKKLFHVENKVCPMCSSEIILRDTEATFCGDCGHILEDTGIIDIMIDEQLRLEDGKIYSAKSLENIVRKKYKDFYFFINALMSSDRMEPHFKVLPKKNRNKINS